MRFCSLSDVLLVHSTGEYTALMFLELFHFWGIIQMHSSSSLVDTHSIDVFA